MVVAPTLVSIRIIVVLVTLVDVTYVVMGQSLTAADITPSIITVASSTASFFLNTSCALLP